MSNNLSNSQQPAYTCNCGPAFSQTTCPFFNRCVEPLAWSLDPSTIPDQPNSPLYTVLPRELRDMIWVYALTDTTSCPVDREPLKGQEGRRSRNIYSSTSSKLLTYPSDIAFGLLQTCKAVYSETWMMPLGVNAYVVPSLKDQMEQCRFLPWQLGLIQHLDITLPQMALEGGEFLDALKQWAPAARHRGSYILPQSWLHNNVSGKITGHPVSFETVLLPPTTLTKHSRQQVPLSTLLSSLPFQSTMRVARARPLTHLTLRLRATDWWTWGSSPSPSPLPLNAKAKPKAKSASDQLHLDPLIGDGRGVRGTSTQMRYLAEERRAGRTVSRLSTDIQGAYDVDLSAEGWGHAISSLLPDLKVLELVLETFKVKEGQLESVVECAQTWEFPIGTEGSADSLVWDGEVLEKRWRRGEGGLRLRRDAHWGEQCREFEVRVVRFARRNGV